MENNSKYLSKSIRNTINNRTSLFTATEKSTCSTRAFRSLINNQSKCFPKRQWPVERSLIYDTGKRLTNISPYILQCGRDYFIEPYTGSYGCLLFMHCRAFVMHRLFAQRQYNARILKYFNKYQNFYNIIYN